MERALTELDIPAAVKDDIKEIVAALLDKFFCNIHSIILFGSYADGKYQPDSDIDIAVVLVQPPDTRQRRAYSLGMDIILTREIDLLFCSREQLSSNTYVYRHINERGIVLYAQL